VVVSKGFGRRKRVALWGKVSPLDLRDPDLPTQIVLGFDRKWTTDLLGRAADTLEDQSRALAQLRAEREQWERERADLQRHLEEEAGRAERVLGEVMLDAHKAAEAVRSEAEYAASSVRAEVEGALASAGADAEAVVAEARRQAAELVHEAQQRRERLATEAERYRARVAEMREQVVTALRHALDELMHSEDEAEAESATWTR
jgi:hypothetical protein